MPVDTEQLLHHLAGHEPDRADDPLDAARRADLAARWRAYRDGTLGHNERRALEAWLGEDLAAYEQLLVEATIEPDQPPASVRQRVLDAFRRPRRGEPRRGWSMAAAPLVAAALIALALGIGLLIAFPGTFSSDEDLPADLAYDLLAYGAALDRDAAPVTGPVEVYPQTRVRLVLRPRLAIDAEIDVGLYRLEGERLVRLAAGDRLSIEQRRGLVTFTASASTLIGDQPASRWLYAVVAPRGSLPRHLTLAPGDDPSDILADGGRRRVHPQQLLVRPPPAATP